MFMADEEENMDGGDANKPAADMPADEAEPTE